MKERDIQIENNSKEIQKYSDIVENLKGQYEEVVGRLEVVCKEKD